MEENLKLLLKDIDKCYLLGGQDLLEREKLEIVETKVRSEVTDIVKKLDDEILQLKVKKLNSGWRSQLKPGFHNAMTAHSTLEVEVNLSSENKDILLRIGQ